MKWLLCLPVQMSLSICVRVCVFSVIKRSSMLESRRVHWYWNPSHHPLSLFQHAIVTYTPVAAASTWSYTSCRAGAVGGSASTAVTTQLAGTATTARRATTATCQRPFPTAKPAKVMPALHTPPCLHLHLCIQTISHFRIIVKVI